MNTPRTTKFWDIIPKQELLNSADDYPEARPTFEESLDAHGKYETMRFVLSLSLRNHELMDSIKFGIHSVEEISFEALQAYSTYLHETVHWWQHVGSTSGLLFSLSYLGQTHGSMDELREILSTFGPKKPLKRWADEVLLREGHGAQAKLSRANIAVNNALDVEYYKKYAFHPKQAAAWLVELCYRPQSTRTFLCFPLQKLGMNSSPDSIRSSMRGFTGDPPSMSLL